MIAPSDPLDVAVMAFACLYVLLVAVVYTRHALRRRRAWNQHGRSRPLYRRLGGPR